MTIHRVPIKAITIPQGKSISIEYWTDSTKEYVAGFDNAGTRTATKSKGRDRELVTTEQS